MPIAELVRWFLAKPRRTQIWRNLSFLPEANTGRTTFSENPVSPNLVSGSGSPSATRRLRV